MMQLSILLTNSIFYTNNGSNDWAKVKGQNITAGRTKYITLWPQIKVEFGLYTKK